MYMNGHGVPSSWVTAQRYWTQAVADGETLFAPKNLGAVTMMLKQFAPMLGKRVALRGLSSQAVNGSLATVTDFCCVKEGSDTSFSAGFRKEASRYVVALDGPERRLVKVKLFNVELVKGQRGSSA